LALLGIERKDAHSNNFTFGESAPSTTGWMVPEIGTNKKEEQNLRPFRKSNPDFSDHLVNGFQMTAV